MSHLVAAVRRQLVHAAARRCLVALHESIADGVKCDDDLTAEAALWDLLDEPAVAATLRDARQDQTDPPVPVPAGSPDCVYLRPAVVTSGGRRYPPIVDGRLLGWAIGAGAMLAIVNAIVR